MYLEMEIMTQDRNVRNVVAKLVDAVLEAAGTDAGSLTIRVDYSGGRAKVRVGTEEVIETKR